MKNTVQWQMPEPSEKASYKLKTGSYNANNWKGIDRENV